MVFASLECKTKCTQCGNPVILNGPALRVLCTSCSSELEIGPVIWKSILEDLPGDIRELKKGEGHQSQIFTGYEFQMKTMRTDPACPFCGKEFSDPEGMAGGGQNAWTCPECGKKTPVQKPPKWMEFNVPDIALIINAEDVEPDGKPEAPAGKPVIFSCPSCGGSLKVDGSDRMIDCTYCQSSIYLPDDLWLRLHPMKKVRTWYIAIEDENSDLDQRKRNRDLMAAAYDGDEDSGVEALNEGADPNCTDQDGRSPLFLAAATDCIGLLRLLIGKKADIDRRDDLGTTPLNIASFNGNAMVVKELLEAGTDVNARNKAGVTPIYGAAKNGHGEVVRLLLESHADPSIPNEDGVTPIEKAREGGHDAVAALLEK